MLRESATPSGQKPCVAIVSVNWNGWHDALECLESVRQLDFPNYVMIVVDNNSEDDSVARIEAWARERREQGYRLVQYGEPAARAGGEPAKERTLEVASSPNRAVLVRNTVNSGPTGGGNLGIEYALRRKPPADYVFLLDNDGRVSPDTLRELMQVSQAEDAPIVGARILDSRTGRVQHAERTTTMGFFFVPWVRDWLWHPPAGVSSWTTCNANGGAMLLRNDVLCAVRAARGNFLDDGLFSDGWEFEVCSFSRQLGYRTVATDRAFIWHSGDLGYRNALNSGRFHHSARNHILLAHSYLPTGWRLVFYAVNIPLCALRIAKCLVRRRPDVARAIIRGTIEGYRRAGERKGFAAASGGIDCMKSPPPYRQPAG
jgi:GT2 family glycosyltransferase